MSWRRGLLGGLGMGALCAFAGPVNIDLGRQLFVDDFLVASSTGVVRHWNRPVKAAGPVVWPSGGAAPKVAGKAPATLTCATDGGLWWDPTRGRFRLWYQAGWLGDVCYAESRDGRHWEYPDLGKVPGTNRVFPDATRPPLDSWDVTPDYAAANPYAAWKMHISSPGNTCPDTLFASDDGLTFRELGVAGHSGDRSTAYYDPFRANWVFSLRDYRPVVGRSRRYFAASSFGGEACRWCWPEKQKAPAAQGKVPDSFKKYPEPV